MLTRSTAAWIADLEARGVPCGPINDYGQVFQDPQVVHRGMRIDLPRGDGGAAATIASPLRPGEASHAYHRAPPLLGEHTTEILADLLGKSRAEIARLHENGALGRSPDRAADADEHPPAGAGRRPSL
jgi:crotonobetainyl-CoA:carnitine CoA-transferase CaiB-like acyl-CoA transferase